MPEPTYPAAIRYQGHTYTRPRPDGWIRLGRGAWVPVQVVGGDSLCACCRAVPTLTRLCAACQAARCGAGPCRVRR